VGISITIQYIYIHSYGSMIATNTNTNTNTIFCDTYRVLIDKLLFTDDDKINSWLKVLQFYYQTTVATICVVKYITTSFPSLLLLYSSFGLLLRALELVGQAY